MAVLASLEHSQLVKPVAATIEQSVRVGTGDLRLWPFRQLNIKIAADLAGLLVQLVGLIVELLEPLLGLFHDQAYPLGLLGSDLVCLLGQRLHLLREFGAAGVTPCVVEALLDL